MYITEITIPTVYRGLSEAEGEALLRERHGQQLRLYRRAVEEITDQRVSRLLIYSFALEREVEVEEKEGEDFYRLT